MLHTPPRRNARTGWVVGAAFALLAAGATPALATDDAPPAVELAYYSSRPEAPQSTSATALRHYLSIPHPEFDLQSYPMYGSLVDSLGRTTAFSVLTQQTNNVSPTLPGLGYAVDGVTWNTGDGFTLGGVQGVPEYTLPFTMTQRPWSIRAQGLSLGTAPQFVDMRVVSGQVGQRGAVYEVTASVNSAMPNGAPLGSTVYVRATDTLGMAQWGYGPSGFMPQWVYPHQRSTILGRFGGSVERYLSATGDPMTGQGSYYYTTPLLRVDSFSIYRGGRRITHGSRGWLLMDSVNQSFGPKAHDIITNDVSWLEFSTQLPDVGKALKIGQVTQASVGALPYAMLADSSTGHNRNGTVATRKWNLDAISIEPVPGHLWTSPRTGLRYHLKYRVRLDGNRSGDPDSVLTYTAIFPDQEVAFAQGRAVYEGLYSVTGTLDGTPVKGQAWAEVQPAGSLS